MRATDRAAVDAQMAVFGKPPGERARLHEAGEPEELVQPQRSPQSARRRRGSGRDRPPEEVILIGVDTEILIVAIVTAAIAFATLILKIVEVSRKA